MCINSNTTTIAADLSQQRMHSFTPRVSDLGPIGLSNLALIKTGKKLYGVVDCVVVLRLSRMSASLRLAVGLRQPQSRNALSKVSQTWHCLNPAHGAFIRAQQAFRDQEQEYINTCPPPGTWPSPVNSSGLHKVVASSVV